MTEHNGAATVGGKLDNLGLRIRAARRQRNLTLQELGGKVGLTASHVSQIERGVTNPSVSSLLSIVTALEFPIEFFFTPDQASSVPSVPGAHATLFRGRDAGDTLDGAPTRSGGGAVDRTASAGSDVGPVVLPDGREVIKIVGGIEWSRLTPTNEDGIEFFQIYYPPGASSGDFAYTHRGREYGVVHGGTLLVELGFSRYVLRAGASIAFDCRIPHRLVNTGDEPAIGTWVVVECLSRAGSVPQPEARSAPIVGVS